MDNTYSRDGDVNNNDRVEIEKKLCAKQKVKIIPTKGADLKQSMRRLREGNVQGSLLIPKIVDAKSLKEAN